MRKIRVLEFSNQWELGGTERNSQTFMSLYNKDEFDFFAAGWTGGRREASIRSMGVELFIEKDQDKMVQWMKEKKIDIVHFYRGGETDHFGISTFKSAEIPILIEHNCFGSFDQSDDREHITKHVVCSKTSVDVYRNRAGSLCDEEKLTYLYCPTETERIGKACIDRDFSAPIFGRYSRKDPLKWHPINILILPIVKSIVPEAKFYVIGLPDEYRAAIQRLGVSDMVVELPSPENDEDILKFLNKITVFTHGSAVGESFGNTIAEAMSAGIPVITHPGGDSAQTELVTDMFNGFVVDSNDVQLYASRLCELLKNPELKIKLGNNGKKRAIEWFDAKDVTKQLENIYKEEFAKRYN